jgi:asparagine N-glycosylation enzyme membrane subunit Stt3
VVAEARLHAWAHAHGTDGVGQVVFFPAGLFLCFRRLGDEHVFAILYGVLSAYFSGIMVRLMLTLTPIACVLGAVAVSTVLDVYLRTPPSNEAAERSAAKTGRKVHHPRALASRPLLW